MSFNAKVTELINAVQSSVKERQGYIEAQEIATIQELGSDACLSFIDEMADEEFKNTLADRKHRSERINELIESQYEKTGEMPDGRQIERLTDVLLYEELNDSNPHKVSQEEYPFLSDVQMERRQFGRRGSQASNMNGEKLTDMSGAESDKESDNRVHSAADEGLASDGKVYRKPIRRTRSTNESIQTENKARSRNAEIRRKYEEFTKVQPVTTWYNVKSGDLRTKEV